MARLDDLRNTRQGLIERMASCDSDQNYATLGRLLVDVVKQIDELDPTSALPTQETDVDEFTKRLNGRRSGAAASGRAASS